MLSASETDRTTVEARRLRAEVEQLLEDNLQLKRHKLEEASTCDGVVKLITRYDRDRHATLDELNAGLAGIISRRTKLRRESRIRDEWEAEVVALQAQVHADGPRYKRLRNIKQKIAADLERDKQQVKQRQAPVGETTAPSTQVLTRCHGRRERDPASSSSESSQSNSPSSASILQKLLL